MAGRRFLEIKTPLGDDLLFHRMRGQEELARLSEFEIDLLSAKGELDFDKIVGKDITVKLELPNDGTRYFHGFVTRFVQRGTHGELLGQMGVYTELYQRQLSMLGSAPADVLS